MLTTLLLRWDESRQKWGEKRDFPFTPAGPTKVATLMDSLTLRALGIFTRQFAFLASCYLVVCWVHQNRAILCGCGGDFYRSPKNRAIFWRPKMRDFLCEENRFRTAISSAKKWVKVVLAAEFPAIPSSAVKIASERRCAILVHSGTRVFCFLVLGVAGFSLAATWWFGEKTEKSLYLFFASLQCRAWWDQRQIGKREGHWMGSRSIPPVPSNFWKFDSFTS